MVSKNNNRPLNFEHDNFYVQGLFPSPLPYLCG